MDKNRLQKIISAPPCSHDMGESVMAFAEGRIENEAERERIMAHMAECDSCRYLFEDYHICEDAIAEAAAEDTRPMPSVAFAIAAGALSPSPSPYLQAEARAPVLGSPGAAVADYRLPLAGGELSLRVIATERGATLAISSADDSAQYYLIGNRG